MKVIIKVDVQPVDFSTPLFQDVEIELRDMISHRLIWWHDASLGRIVEATVTITEVSEG